MKISWIKSDTTYNFWLVKFEIKKKTRIIITGLLHILHFYLKDMSRKVCEIFFDTIERWDQLTAKRFKI